MDFEDGAFVAGICVILVGAIWLGSVMGICVAGLLMAFPAVLALLRGGPPQPPKGT